MRRPAASRDPQPGVVAKVITDGRSSRRLNRRRAVAPPFWLAGRTSGSYGPRRTADAPDKPTLRKPPRAAPIAAVNLAGPQSVTDRAELSSARVGRVLPLLSTGWDLCALLSFDAEHYWRRLQSLGLRGTEGAGAEWARDLQAKQVSEDRACAAGLRVSGHAGVGTALRGEGQSDRVCRNGDGAEPTTERLRVPLRPDR